ncbi:MAG: hypothetical protein N2F24_04700, partial [Deltaproteobacteria bacterium]
MENSSEYQKEQQEALGMIRKHLSGLSGDVLAYMKAQISEYLAFRQEVDRFLEKHFSLLCTD